MPSCDNILLSLFDIICSFVRGICSTRKVYISTVLMLHLFVCSSAAQTPMPWNQLSASLWPSQSPWKSWISPSFVLQKPWSDTKCFDAWLDGAGTLTSSPIQFVAKGQIGLFTAHQQRPLPETKWRNGVLFIYEVYVSGLQLRHHLHNLLRLLL